MWLLRRLVRGVRGIDQRRLPIFVCLIPMAVLVIIIFVAVWMAFREPGAPGETSLGIGAFPELYGDPLVRTALINTAIFTLAAIATSLFFGATAAWLVERTNLRFKVLPRTLMVIGLLTPTFLSAMGWVLLLHPRIGVINKIIHEIPGFAWFTIDISHPAAMGIVQGVGLSAVVFIMVSASFRAMNPALEEAASIHGMGFLRRLSRITLPLTFPGILAAGIYVAAIAIAAFDIPAILGLGARVFTFSTFLYMKIYPAEGLPRYDLAGAFGILMIVASMLLLWWYFRTLRQSHKYAVVTGKAYRPSLIELGRWQVAAWVFLGSFFFIAKILPILILIYCSLLPYLQAISLTAFSQMGLDNYRNVPWDYILKGARNTGILMVSVPTLTLTMSVFFSWVVIRSRTRFRFIFDVFAFLPHAMPNVLLAVSALFIVLFILPGWLPLYGNILLVIGMYAIIYISFTTRMINSALLQIHEELDEAAVVSGIPMLRTFWKILLPLLKPALFSAWLWVALLAYRELTMAAFLTISGNPTLPRAIWGIWLQGSYSLASAAACITLTFMIPLVFLYWFLGRRALATTER